VVSLPQITTAPLISRSGNEQMLPASIHKLPSSSIADKPDRGIGVKGQDIGDNGREFERLNKLDRKQTTPTRIDARTGKVEKAEKEAETRLAANTTDDASGVRKTQYQLEPSCR
jgi:hypothetical protein